MHSLQKVLQECPLVSLRQLMLFCVLFDGQTSLYGVPEDDLASLLLNNLFNLTDSVAIWLGSLIRVSGEEVLGEEETCALKFAVFCLLQLILVGLALSTMIALNVATKRG